MQELEKLPDLTKLRILIFDHNDESTCGGTRGGPNQPRREEYDFLQYAEFWEALTSVEKVSTVVPMTQFQALKHWIETKGNTPDQAQRKWEQLKQEGEKGSDDEDGEETYHVFVGKMSQVKEIARQGQRVEGSLKAKKNPKAEDVQALQSNLETRSACTSLSDGVLALRGGDSLARVSGVKLAHSPKKAKDVGMVEGAAKMTGKKRQSSDVDLGTSVSDDTSTTASSNKRLKDVESSLNNLRISLSDHINDLRDRMCKTIESWDMVKKLLTDTDKELDGFKQLWSTVEIRMLALALAESQRLKVTVIWSRHPSILPRPITEKIQRIKKVWPRWSKTGRKTTRLCHVLVSKRWCHSMSCRGRSELAVLV